jgi:hypothetical protein
MNTGISTTSRRLPPARGAAMPVLITGSSNLTTTPLSLPAGLGRQTDRTNGARPVLRSLRRRVLR